MSRFEYTMLHNKNRAFTLIEVLIVLIVIAALAGLLYLAFGGSSESAKKAACEGEREKIKNAYAMQRYASGGNFQTAIKTVMDDVPQASADSLGSSEAKYEGLCGDGGIYTIQPASISLFISCDKHGGDELVLYASDSGHSTGSTIPGTVIPPMYTWDSIEALNATISANGGTLTINKGNTFYINSKYYVYNGEPFIVDTSTYGNNPFSSGVNNVTRNLSYINVPEVSAGYAAPEWSSIVGTTVQRGTVVKVTSGSTVTYYAKTSAGNVAGNDSPINNSGTWVVLQSSNK